MMAIHFRNAFVMDLMSTERPIRTVEQVLKLIRPKFRGKMEAKHLPHMVHALIDIDKQFQWIRINNFSVLKSLNDTYGTVVLCDPSLKLKFDFKTEFSFSKFWEGYCLVDKEENSQEESLKFLGKKLCVLIFVFFCR